MSSLLVSIRISGAEPDTLQGVLEPRLNELLRQLSLLPGIEAECFMSPEQFSTRVVSDSFASKPRINDHPVPLSSAVSGRIYAQLGRYGFITLNQLAWMSRREIGYIVGIAKKSLDAIEASLQRNGMEFLSDGIPLGQRDWEFLPVRALILTRYLPESSFPRRIDRKLELGRYLNFGDERLAAMLGDIDRDIVPSAYSDQVGEHREFIERVRSLVS